ncbi:large-conductance mechanosensitive channel protein MscL [Proteiniclasticum sp. BAD-10]|uniref:Large-conductance mechanosensitive channel n=1 Tax=Proteiniclasticum sediminis TaxID=2804028 RepID=A0A941CQG4_9CLOT|nr:large-conductance mechanosensitive channel protein MscL [Proteiniclasticum sediminis]MBR0576219.1 large-conductance mechanosensitive channel protein MscL [Proteiniclasticum sediminis]
MKKFLQDFKAFAVKGNVLDLAVAVIIGGAFGAIVTSFVKDLVMPLIGAIFAVPDFTALSFTVNGTPIMIGAFIQAVVNFLIVAFAIFVMIRLIEKFKKKEPAAPPAPTKEELLLTEIRDLLKNK